MMFVAILLGIVNIVKGILYLVNSDIFITDKIMNNVDKHQIKDFKKGMVLPHFLLSIIFISMGIVDKMNIFKKSASVAIFIILVICPLYMILANSKKYSGKYWL